MTRADQIRECLMTLGATSEDGALTRAQLQAVLGFSKAHFGSGINDLKRSGYVATVGESRFFRYYLTGKVRTFLTEEEKQDRELARHTRKRRAKGCVCRADYLAECATRKAARLAAKAEAKRARKAERAAKRLAAQAQRKQATTEARRAAMEARKKAAVAVVRVKAAKRVQRIVKEQVSRFTSIAPIKQVQPAQTVEEFLAQGGQIERLESFTYRPLRAMPFNGGRYDQAA